MNQVDVRGNLTLTLGHAAIACIAVSFLFSFGYLTLQGKLSLSFQVFATIGLHALALALVAIGTTAAVVGAAVLLAISLTLTLFTSSDKKSPLLNNHPEKQKKIDDGFRYLKDVASGDALKVITECESIYQRMLKKGQVILTNGEAEYAFSDFLNIIHIPSEWLEEGGFSEVQLALVVIHEIVHTKQSKVGVAFETPTAERQAFGIQRWVDEEVLEYGGFSLQTYTHYWPQQVDRLGRHYIKWNPPFDNKEANYEYEKKVAARYFNSLTK